MNDLKKSIQAGTSKILGREMLIMLGMLMLIGCFVFYKSITGFAVYLFKDIGRDSLNYSYPGFINIAETLWRGELPGWSFEQGLGQNVFPFSLSDPTTYPLYLLGSENLAFGIIWVELFKIIGSGLLFFSFLKKRAVDTRAAYMGGLLYAFSGFMIIGSGWYIFSTLGLYVALILLSFEMLYLERKWWLFPISIALLAALNVVNLYTCSVFLFLYVVFRVFGDEAGNFKQFSKLLVSMALLGALGILISSVLSLANLMQMLDSPRVSGEASYVNSLASLPMFELGSGSYLLTLLMRTFSSDLLGNGSAYTGWRNYLEAPMSYCGLVTLLLIPQLFTFLRARQRLVYGTILGIFIFAAIFPWFRRGFWLFQGDYFRDYSLYTAVIFILFSVFALDRIIKGGKVHLMVLIGSLIVLLTLLYFPYSQQHERNDDGLQFSIDSVIQSKVTLFLILLTLILVLFSVKRLRQTMPVFLIVMVILELTILADHTVNQRDTLTTEELHKKIGYNDYSNEAITFIKQRDKDFFRLEKNYWSSPIKYSSFNDAKVQHYFGSSSYHSFNQINYIKFLSTADVLNAKIEEQTRWSPGVKRQPLLQLLTGVRYLLFKGNWKTSLGINYFSEIAKFGDVAVLQFQYALPMGVSYDTYITQSEFNQLDSNRKRIALLKGVMVSDAFTPQIPATMNALSRNDVAPNGYSLDELTLDTDKLKANPLHITSFSNNHIEGEITVASQQLLFFSIPFDVGWSAQINNQNVEMVMVDGGLSAVFVEPGKNVVELYYFPPFVKMGLLLTVLGVLIFLGLLRRKQLLD